MDDQSWKLSLVKDIQKKGGMSLEMRSHPAFAFSSQSLFLPEETSIRNSSSENKLKKPGLPGQGVEKGGGRSQQTPLPGRR